MKAGREAPAQPLARKNSVVPELSRTLESPAKPAMHAPPATRTACLTPDNVPSSAPFGAFAPNAAQAAIISLAQRSGLKRGAGRPGGARRGGRRRGGPGGGRGQG